MTVERFKTRSRADARAFLRGEGYIVSSMVDGVRVWNEHVDCNITMIGRINLTEAVYDGETLVTPAVRASGFHFDVLSHRSFDAVEYDEEGVAVTRVDSEGRTVRMRRHYRRRMSFTGIEPSNKAERVRSKTRYGVGIKRISQIKSPKYRF